MKKLLLITFLLCTHTLYGATKTPLLSKLLFTLTTPDDSDFCLKDSDTDECMALSLTQSGTSRAEYITTGQLVKDILERETDSVSLVTLEEALTAEQRKLLEKAAVGIIKLEPATSKDNADFWFSQRENKWCATKEALTRLKLLTKKTSDGFMYWQEHSIQHLFKTIAISYKPVTGYCFYGQLSTKEPSHDNETTLLASPRLYSRDSLHTMPSLVRNLSICGNSYPKEAVCEGPTLSSNLNHFLEHSNLSPIVRSLVISLHLEASWNRSPFYLVEAIRIAISYACEGASSIVKPITSLFEQE